MSKVMTARYPGKCVNCKQAFPVGTAIVYNTSLRTTAHTTCPPVVHVVSTLPAIDVRNIVAFIDGAKQRGLKFPKLRVLDPTGTVEALMFVTTRGSAPGSVAVKVGGRFVGTVTPQGEGRGAFGSDVTMRTWISVVNSAPLAAAKMFAAIKCSCSFCGLPLTDEGSTEVGYGPVCAKNWGLPHKAKGTQELSPVVEVVVTPEPSPVDDLLHVAVEDIKRNPQAVIEAFRPFIEDSRAQVAQRGLW